MIATSTQLLLWRVAVSSAVVIVWQRAARRALDRWRVRRELRDWKRREGGIFTFPADVPIATIREVRETEYGLDWTAELTDEAVAAGITPEDVTSLMMRISLGAGSW